MIKVNLINKTTNSFYLDSNIFKVKITFLYSYIVINKCVIRLFHFYSVV